MPGDFEFCAETPNTLDRTIVRAGTRQEQPPGAREP